MERKIGEIFNYDGEWYQCIGDDNKSCTSCDMNFDGKCPISVTECDGSFRSDNSDVCFKRLEKVGEPYADYCPSGRVIYFQRYKCYQKPIYNGDFICWSDDISISIEIKNKEDIEENNNAKHSNTENIGKNLKAFDLQAAKSGKPVCTRDGRKAIFLTTLSNKNFPVVAIVSCGQEENIYQYDINGVCDEHDNNLDLMMPPEKKEGWVNLYRDEESKRVYCGESIFSEREKAEKHYECNDTKVATVSIGWEE